MQRFPDPMIQQVGKWLESLGPGPLCQRIDGSNAGSAPLFKEGRNLCSDIQVKGERVRALCDTGAGVGLVFDSRAGGRFKLKQPPRNGGDTLFAIAGEVQAGDAKFRNVNAQVLTFPQEFPFEVILGTKVFSKGFVEIDAEAMELRWGPSNPEAQGSFLFMSGGVPLMAVELNSESQELFVIDTGAERTTRDHRLVEGHPFPGTYLPLRFLAMSDGCREAFIAPNTRLRGCEFDVEMPCLTTEVWKNRALAEVHPAGLLGLDLIRRVRIDYPARLASILPRAE